MHHTQQVMFGLGKHRVDGKLQPLGELCEPGVRRSLHGHAVVHYKNAPRPFLGSYSQRCCSNT